MKFFHSALTFIFFFLYQEISVASSSLQASFNLIKNHPNNTFSATITIRNNLNTAMKHWQLGFTFNKSIIKFNEATIQQQVGSYYLISPISQKVKVIHPKSEIVLNLMGKQQIKNVSDVPSGYFLVVTNPDTPSQSIISLSSKINFPTDNNNTTPSAVLNTFAKPMSIIPMPVMTQKFEGSFFLTAKTNLVIDKNSLIALQPAKFFAKAISSATGYSLIPTISKLDKTSANSIIFKKAKTKNHLGKEGYDLHVTQKQILVTANTEAGFFYALQSLRQLLPPAIFSREPITTITWNIPAVHLIDYPRFSYRGMLLDVVRHFMNAEDVKRFIDLMALHKLNYLQLHLTDDEGWRIEIKHYPELTNIGAWRGYNKPLPPSYGTGSGTYGGYYTQREMREIIKYAQDRHITIIPEIDIPSHARALLMSLPNLLIDKGDQSKYSSAQRYHDNVLSPGKEATYLVLENIFNEVADIFPADTIHVGSDEVPAGAWLKSSLCQQRITSLGLKNTDDLHHYFLTRIEQFIQTKK